jgi:V8-like Glu-specific endopeptidase
MVRQTKSILRLILPVFALGIPLLAHHSFGAEYDANKPITLTGVVTKIDWTNPHSYFYLDVKDDKGNVANWKFEGYPPGVLYRTGWKREVTMKPGDTITVFGWRARDGTNWAHSRQVTLADGKKLFFGPPAGTGDGGNTPSVAVPVAAQ